MERLTMRIVTRIAMLSTIMCALVDPRYVQGANVGNNCGLDQFQCRSGECKAGELLCDGKADCRDQSDETEIECTRPEILCPAYAFRCKYGACVNSDVVCNGIQDCVDNSDETQPQCATSSGNQTERPLLCKKDQFTCDNGQCIHSISVCNGETDCADGSDEVFAKCGSLICAPMVFRCAYGACIAGDLRCNGVINCADGSDEDPVVCNSTWQTPFPTPNPTPIGIRSSTTTSTTGSCELPSQPPNGRWKLHPLHCTSNRDNCDVPPGTMELPLGSQLVYFCNAGYKIRGNTNVTCGFGGNWLTIPDCIALVDPRYVQDANVSNNCGLDQFQCRGGECIAGELLCDGKADCRDQSDETEIECARPEILCPAYAFRCKYGACVNSDVVCNGIQDCVDNSDETQPQCATSSGNQTERPLLCKKDQFTCDNGQCIHSISVCNGETDCADGSDEVFAKCGSLICAPMVFRCAYGACIAGDLRCNGVVNCADGSDEDPVVCNSPWQTPFPTPNPTPIGIRSSTTTSTTGSCELPSQPPNGRWKLHPLHCTSNRDNCDVPPGTMELPLGSQLVYFCNAGYKIRGNTNVTCGFGGNWLTIPDCIPEIRCKGLNTASVFATCRHNIERVSCETPVLPGTMANLRCQDGYQPKINQPLNQGNNVICNANGLWEPEPLKCIPVCGVLPAAFTPLVVGGHGFQANITEFPWHASIYRDFPDEPKKYICGATIIQENFLVTAAHCVYSSSSKGPLDSSTIHIVTGNVYRDYDSPLHHNKIVQKAEVKNIYIACHYQDYDGNYGSDIAILELVEPFVLSPVLAPACISTSINDQVIPDTNAYGKVAGFGRTEFGESSAILVALTLPYISYSHCKSASKNVRTEHYITPDKFCAGYTNGSSVCQGDSGSGLVFQTDGLWFLRGIVSVSLSATNKGAESLCNFDSYSLFTRVSGYTEWIQEVIINLEARRPYSSCLDKL